MQKLLGNLPKGFVFSLAPLPAQEKPLSCGCSLKNFPAYMRAFPARPGLPRSGEVEGKDYHFLSQ